MFWVLLLIDLYTNAAYLFRLQNTCSCMQICSHLPQFGMHAACMAQHGTLLFSAPSHSNTELKLARRRLFSHLLNALQDRLDLRPEQRQEMTNLREHFLHSLAECHEAREAICLGLQKVSGQHHPWKSCCMEKQQHLGLLCHHASRRWALA